MGLQSRDLAWVPIPRLAGVDVQGADHPTVQLHPCSRSPTRPSSCSRLIGLADAGRRRGAAALGQRVGPDAQAVEDGQERLAQGPCAVAFSQRLPAAIRNIKLEPDWQEFTQVLVGEGICAALSVPSGPGPVLGPGCPGRRCFWPGRWDRSAWRCLPFWYLVGEPVSRPGSKRRPRASPWQMPVTTTADDLAGSLTGPRSQT
jgi:hypothetical protein